MFTCWLGPRPCRPGLWRLSAQRILNLPSLVVTVHRMGLFSNWDFSLQHTSNVLEWLHQQFQFSVIWGHYVYPAGYMAVVFAELNGIASTVSARGNDIDRLMFPPGDFARLTWTLDRATAVSCVSRELAQKVEMLLGRSIDVAVFAKRRRQQLVSSIRSVWTTPSSWEN